MKIEGSSQFIPKARGLGQNTSAINSSNFLNINRVSSSSNIFKTCEEVHNHHKKLGLEADARIRNLNDNLFRKFGIRGEVTASSIQSYPQNFGVFYIETVGYDTPNKVIFELENGEFLLGETSLDWDSVHRLLDIFRGEHGFNNGRFCESRLRELFELFLERVI